MVSIRSHGERYDPQAAARKLVELINSRPQTPSLEEIEEVLSTVVVPSAINYRTPLTATLEEAIARFLAAELEEYRTDAGPDTPERRQYEACRADLRTLEERIPRPPTGIGDV